MSADLFDRVVERTEFTRDPLRDPRLLPQPGDILAVGDDVREVWDLSSNRVEYAFPGKAATRWLSLEMWRLWARRAEVRKVQP